MAALDQIPGGMGASAVGDLVRPGYIPQEFLPLIVAAPPPPPATRLLLSLATEDSYKTDFSRGKASLPLALGE